MRGIHSLTAASLALALSVPARAETNVLDRATEQFYRDRKNLIADSLKLTAPEAAAFWPLYERFQQDLNAMVERRRRIIGEFGENYDDMSDEKAKQILVERLAIEDERCHLVKAYFPRFERVLPIKKVARYFQVEGKIHASVEAGIAEQLPLIK